MQDRRVGHDYLTDQRVLGASPAVGVKSPKVTRQPKGKGLAEGHRLLDAATAEGPNEEAIVCLLGLNGLRVSEVCAAQIEDLRCEAAGGRSLRVRGKGSPRGFSRLAAAERLAADLLRRAASRRRRRLLCARCARRGCCPSV